MEGTMGCKGAIKDKSVPIEICQTLFTNEEHVASLKYMKT